MLASLIVLLNYVSCNEKRIRELGIAGHATASAAQSSLVSRLCKFKHGHDNDSKVLCEERRRIRNKQNDVIVISPAASELVLKAEVVISCSISPPSDDSEHIYLYSPDTVPHRRNQTSVVLRNSVVYQRRCLCFNCMVIGLATVVKCYFFSMVMQIQVVPKQDIYFAWSNSIVHIFFTDPHKKDRTYPAKCYNTELTKNLVLEGFILNKYVKGGTYTLACRIPFVYKLHYITMDIFGEEVKVWITPEKCDFYVDFQMMEVSCNIQPSEILSIIPNINFTKINSSEFSQVSERRILIGGPDRNTSETICVVCGHPYLPYNASRCFAHHVGPAKVVITPNLYELKIYENNEITCQYFPEFIPHAEMPFYLTGIPHELYVKTDDLKISIKFDRYLADKEICAICGDTPMMNSTSCYMLIADRRESKFYAYFMSLVIVLALILVIIYIYKNEVM